MADGIDLNPMQIEMAFSQFGAWSTRDLGEELEAQAGGVARNLIEDLPPANNRAKGTAAKKAGERKIQRDLRAIFEPVPIWGWRALNAVFGRPVDPPIEVPQRERHTDLETIYRARLKRRRGGGPITRGRAQAYYVDEKKFAALEKRLLPRVGVFVAGFGPAAEALKVRQPQYMRRHHSPGGVRIQRTSRRLQIDLWNNVRFAREVPNLGRRMQAAVDLQAVKMVRQIPHILRRHARRARLRAR